MEVKEISKELGVSEKELVKKGVKAYLETELGRVRVEISETDTFDDFTQLDFWGQ